MTGKMDFQVQDMAKQTLAICFTNFGPYHIARLSALGEALAKQGGQLLAYEMAGSEEKYPWQEEKLNDSGGLTHVRLFPGRSLESISPRECRRAMLSRLDMDQPTAIAAVGYARPESMAMLSWAKASGALRILLSESQKKDMPRAWWKEAIKSRRVRQFQSALVGGETHRDYLVDLGMDRNRIELGYNAVGNERIEKILRECQFTGREGHRPYFLSVCRFAPEKNLHILISAYAEHVKGRAGSEPWRLVLAGDGPLKADLMKQAEMAGIGNLVSWPGFLPLDQLVPLYAGCGAFVLPSLSEPWGLVANEAALCGAPLLLSDRCGATATFLPERGFPAGRRFDAENTDELTDAMTWMVKLPEQARRAMGETARRIAGLWGPDRFASGLLAAIKLAGKNSKRQESMIE